MKNFACRGYEVDKDVSWVILGASLPTLNLSSQRPLPTLSVESLSLTRVICTFHLLSFPEAFIF